jgi:single-stranded-DNA-specific exonuclease
MSRLWTIKADDLSATHPPEFLAASDNLPVLATLLQLRGITTAHEAQAFLHPEDYEPASPYLFADMEKAVERILQAIETQEPVLVYGDFDVDGVTGTSILMETLKYLKLNVSFYIPERHTESHGMNSTALIRLVSSRQLKLIVTTDTGSSNFNEVSMLNGLGVDTIIGDHHDMPEQQPPCLAFLNPKYLPKDSPLAHLSGAGVAFKMSEALLNHVGAPVEVLESLLDLAAIGTVVDLVPLKAENRNLVWRGLQQLAKRQRLGLSAILKEANINTSAPINTQTLGFSIGPRINALGRLSRADEAVQLLITKDSEEAAQLAGKLEQCNRKRREMVDECLMQAESHLINSGELADKRAIILCSPDWNSGIVGLVATRLTEKYRRPSFLGCVDEADNLIRFSARSIEGFHLFERLEPISESFSRWGGHAGAAGLAIPIEHLNSVKQKIFTICAEHITEEMMIPRTTVDIMLSPSQVSTHLIDLVERMSPFGQGNPFPVFGLNHMTIGAQKMMGEKQQHLKFILTHRDVKQHFEAVCWNAPIEYQKMNVHNPHKVAFTLEKNSFNGIERVQLLMKDIQDETRKAEVLQLNQRLEQTETALRKTTVILPKALKTSPWIDHRRRPDIEAFLMQTLPAEEAALSEYALFCEGSPPVFSVPFKLPKLAHRFSLSQEATHVLLWDLPPDLKSLNQIVANNSERIVHLLGAKYQKIPIIRPAEAYLEGLYKTVLKLAKVHQHTQFSARASDLAVMLATTDTVVLAGLAVLEKMTLLQTRYQPALEQLDITLNTDKRFERTDDIQAFIEYPTFGQALNAVHRFRFWLMQTSIEDIQASVLAEKEAAQAFKQHQKEHVTGGNPIHV